MIFLYHEQIYIFISLFLMSTYTPLNSKSFCSVLREDLGGWCYDALPKAFMSPNNSGWNTEVDLSKNIIYGIVVDTIKDINNGVTVIGTDRATSNKIKVTDDAVILKVPLQILRQMNIDFPIEMQKPLANITYEASSKMILQCKNRFWQKDIGQGASPGRVSLSVRYTIQTGPGLGILMVSAVFLLYIPGPKMH